MKKYDLLKDYLRIFEEEKNKPLFLDKYYVAPDQHYNSKTLQRIKNISVYCGCDYTKIYNPLFFYSRFYHSLVVANMTWYFTHNKKYTIAALLHDAGTPCFAHTIDYALGDYKNQESAEKKISDIIYDDFWTKHNLKNDGIELDELDELLKNPILENKTPRLCTDRLDGVLGTCFIWLHTHSLEEIKAVFDDLCVLNNEDGIKEIGFKSENAALSFCKMVKVYANELQTNRDKFVMQYIADVIKEAINKEIITFDDLYKLKERDLIEIFRNNFDSWKQFEDARKVKSTNREPKGYYISFETKKRNVIPLVQTENGAKRITEVSSKANKLFSKIEKYDDKEFGYVKTIKKI